MDSTTVDRFGRVLLPKPVRKRLGIKAGDALSLEVERGRLVLKPVQAGGEWVVKNGIPTWTGPVPEEMHDIVAFIRRLRDERDRHVLGLDRGEAT
jgi:AbrB family looped-hinge helix DNA binding protein